MEKVVDKKKPTPIVIRFTHEEALLLRDFTGLTSTNSIRSVGIAEEEVVVTNEAVYQLYKILLAHIRDEE